VGSSEGAHGDVVGKLLFEPDEIADVVHALVEPAGELGRDRLQWNLLLGEERENHEQLRRSLRLVGLIHADLDDDVAPAGLLDVPPDRAGLPAGKQIGAGDPRHGILRQADHLRDPRHGQRLRQLGVTGNERLHVGQGSRLADRIGDVDREKITRLEKPVDRLEADVVGIDEPRVRPLSGRHGPGRRRPHARGLTADERMLTVRLVPHWGDDDAPRREHFKGGELRLGLAGETIADPER
jgi:hypothetical protein